MKISLKFIKILDGQLIRRRKKREYVRRQELMIVRN